MPPKPYWNVRSDSRSPSAHFTRRRFLQASAAAVSGVALSNCARNLSTGSQGANSPEARGGSNSGADNTLHIYTWANYIDEELIQSFQDATGIRAIVDIYDSNEVMLTRLEAGGGSAYSIVYPSDYAVTQMIESDLLAPLDQSQLTGLNNLKAQWQNPTYDPGNAHSVPATWGTTGLIYNPELLGATLTGWDTLYDNIGSLTRQVTLINDVREVMGATLQYLGYSLNSTNPDEIEAAYEKLLELRPTIAAFLTNGWEDQLASGDLTVAMAYSSDALALIEENPGLEYVVPETGASLWTDTMAIPKTAPNVDAAYQWINFVMEPENSARLVERLKFATPSQAAFDLLPNNLKTDDDLFPPDSILHKTAEVAVVPPDIADLYDRYWTQLTSG
ncbi:polyamine ABC transporter substrate-binding protein [filamentous cyanobacterium CCP2]|nr:polyamine ABC transporter substrate-binding protein [filamentous cyanobacterium CCP2]